MARKLVIIPIIHSEAEMGSLNTAITEVLDEAFGKDSRDEHRKQVLTFWDNISALTQKILKAVDPSSIVLYQDGMPAGGEVGRRLVEEGVKDHIPNHRILQSLIEAGARLEKTENPTFLKQEYGILREILCAESGEKRESLAAHYQARLGQLTQDRDVYIGRQIDETLKDGETGIVFIGASHDIGSHLPRTIRVYVRNKDTDVELLEWLKSIETGG